MQKKTNIKTAIMRKYPEQVVIVTTRGLKGNANAMAVGWVAIASDEPLMFMLGIDERAYTYQLINESREFVVAFPNENMWREVRFVGSCHGQGRDKLKETGLKIQKAVHIKAPLIADAVANFECELVEIVKPGDSPIIFGKVVAAHVNKDPKVRRLYTVGKSHLMGGVIVTRTTET